MVAGARVIREDERVQMEGHRRRASRINVAEHPGDSPHRDLEEVELIRVRAVALNERNRVEARAVMAALALPPAFNHPLAVIRKVAPSGRGAVVCKIGGRGHVGKDRIDGTQRELAEARIARIVVGTPHAHLLLTRRIPIELAAVRSVLVHPGHVGAGTLTAKHAETHHVLDQGAIPRPVGRTRRWIAHGLLGGRIGGRRGFLLECNQHLSEHRPVHQPHGRITHALLPGSARFDRAAAKGEEGLGRHLEVP